MGLAHLVYPTTFVLYADYRYGWGLKMVGWTLLIVGVLSVIVQGALISRIVKAIGERRALLLGLACGTLGLAQQTPRVSIGDAERGDRTVKRALSSDGAKQRDHPRIERCTAEGPLGSESYAHLC